MKRTPAFYFIASNDLFPVGYGGVQGLTGQNPGALLHAVQPEQNTKLYRSYVLHQDARSVLRHRGKSPRQAAFFRARAASSPACSRRPSSTAQRR
jgi:hypothetical protein